MKTLLLFVQNENLSRFFVNQQREHTKNNQILRAFKGKLPL
jgi:hypothetical protein